MASLSTLLRGNSEATPGRCSASPTLVFSTESKVSVYQLATNNNHTIRRESCLSTCLFRTRTLGRCCLCELTSLQVYTVLLDAFIMPSIKSVGVVAPSMEYARQYNSHIQEQQVEAGGTHITQLSEQTECVFQGTQERMPLKRYCNKPNKTLTTLPITVTDLLSSF